MQFFGIAVKAVPVQFVGSNRRGAMDKVRFTQMKDGDQADYDFVFLTNDFSKGSISGAGGYIPEDARSHLSAMSRSSRRNTTAAAAAAAAVAASKARSIGDLTGKSYGPGFGLGLSRQGWTYFLT